MKSRRKFLQQSCIACLSFSTLGILIESCGTTKRVSNLVYEANKFTLPLSDFIDRQTIVIRHRSLPYEILVVKQEKKFTALQMRCTHNDVALNFTGQKLVCNAHGSEFDLEGKVRKEPAAINLTQYATSSDTHNLYIHL
ncbi:MAG: Rieske (2Fe-2S) protein [Bacteroidetes bacterium]|nr:Rieske (2Fe-2S) protein [Bacteroidota bacterium]